MVNESKIMQMVKAKQVKKQKGASMIEYALVVAGVAIIAGILFGGTDGGTVGTAIDTKVTGIINGINP
ncbi:Flp family type IVb pilin [Thiomicrorhabdus cannonii]|uniref:Flp family type IVb pilin n=1 Tax=Thiomicrorhabdus cannonii TaxID=2748011 RepID=UPI0015BF0DF5|nr:Flp family type IVb pilin [Thiomicrorhabdus cannonii]